MRDKMSLTSWLFLKIIPILFLTICYWLIQADILVVSGNYAQPAILLICAVLLTLGRRKDLVDEGAKNNLKTTDAACLKVAFFLMFIFAAVELPRDSVGYFAICSALLLAILRAIIFTILGRKGL